MNQFPLRYDSIRQQETEDKCLCSSCYILQYSVKNGNHENMLFRWLKLFLSKFWSQKLDF